MRKNAVEKGIEELCKAHPETTHTQAERFFLAFGKKHAAHHLGNYLAWRSKFSPSKTKKGTVTNGSSDDTAYWDYATTRTGQHLTSHSTEEEEDFELSENATVSTSSNNDASSDSSDGESGDGQSKVSFASSSRMSLKTSKRRYRLESAAALTFSHDPFPIFNLDLMPRFVRTHRSSETGDFIRDYKGHRVVHALPAQLDPALPAEAYAMAIGLYLEQLFQDNEEEGKYEQVTVMLDVRVGLGWPNVPALQLVSLIRNVSNQLNMLHPNRLHKCVLFPIPRAAIALWKATLKPFLDSKLRQSIELVSGTGANLNSPPPNDKLAAFVPAHDLEQLERHRKSQFTPAK